MKITISLLAFAALAFTSCTSAYKTGQTPDDVYYSPVRPQAQDEYVDVERQDDRRYRGSEEYNEDRYLRYRVRNPYRWSALDDYYYSPAYSYHYGGYNSWYSSCNNYYSWNYYNPYYGGGVYIKTPSTFVPPSRAVTFNPNSYTNNTNNSRSVNLKSGNINNAGRYNNNNSFGNSIRRIFSGSGNNSSNSSGGSSVRTYTPTRSYTPSSSGGSSGGGGSRSTSTGGGGGSRPSR
jgi:hypothetical protein